jgi:hypothetical protein
MEVRRRIKVDFPQPESAATPMTMGVTPGSRAIWSLLEGLAARRLEGMKAVGAKADAEAAPKAKARDSFMVDVKVKLCVPKNSWLLRAYARTPADDVRQRIQNIDVAQVMHPLYDSFFLEKVKYTVFRSSKPRQCTGERERFHSYSMY